jgi:hypothetical protein
MDPEKILAEIFKLDAIKGKKRTGQENDERKWRLTNFRTNGVKVVLTFCSGMEAAKGADNVCHLCDAGYNIPMPKCPIDVGLQRRGLFCVRPNRNDIATGTCDHSVVATVVDPGKLRPVQFCSLGGAALMNDPSALSIATTGRFEHVTEDAWMRESGRQRRQEDEEKRRVVNPMYEASIQALSATRRRSCKCFLEYSRACMEHLGTRLGELACCERSRFRWKYERLLMSFVDKVADRLFQRSSFRVGRNVDNVDRTKLSDAERMALRSALRRKRAERLQHQHVVFFGDGSFSASSRGHVSIPKKRLLKSMAVRGLTFLLSENFTSKRCPCGHDDLKDGIYTGGVRVRVHKTDGGVCDVLEAVRDRDELACINMMLSASSAMRSAVWPTHLTRDGLVTNSSH